MLDFLSARGFNRISLGVQDFDPAVQAAVGREQPFELVAEVLRSCRRFSFTGINFDLIYGLPRQTVVSFSKTLDLTLQLRPDRVAVYSFAYLPKLRPHQKAIPAEELPSTEEKYRLFAAAVERFTEAGYRQIGMDHFALPTDELVLAQQDGRLYRNFMGYTVKTSPDMLGFGMSAISCVDDAFFQNASGLESYDQAVEKGNWPVFRGIRLSRDDLVRQWVIMSLMCNFTLPFDELKRRFNIEYHEYFAPEHERLDELIRDGLLIADRTGLTVTPVGRTFVRNIAMTFDAYLARDDFNGKVTFSRTI
jgi:oxygen-independent coproporphyrinogen-3 oxidase